MKINLTEKNTQGTYRNINAMADALISLTSKKQYEKINVSEICKESNYPRSTFYNYFDDKDDLLNFCWYRIKIKMSLSDHVKIESEKVIGVFFDRIYDIFEENKPLINKILKNNGEQGELISSFSRSMKQTIYETLLECTDLKSDDVPAFILAEYISDTLFLLCSYSFLKRSSITRSDAQKYLEILLKNAI